MKTKLLLASAFLLATPAMAAPFAKGVKITKLNLDGTGCFIETDDKGKTGPNYTTKIKNRKGKAQLSVGFKKLALNSRKAARQVGCTLDVTFEVTDPNVKFYVYRARVRGNMNLKEGVSVKFAPSLSLPMHDEEIPNQPTFNFKGPDAGTWNEGLEYEIPQMPKCGLTEYRVVYDLDLFMKGKSDITSEFNITSKDSETKGKSAFDLEFKVDPNGCEGHSS